jgi:hypothetical protein
MMKKAQQNGLTFRGEVTIDGDALKGAIADSYKEFAYGIYPWISKPLYRTIGQEPDLRDDGSHINVNETIGKSVFDRWRADPMYRPKNLVEWADRKHVDPATLMSSVRADDPRVEVLD